MTRSLQTVFASVELENPLVLASGILGVSPSLAFRVAKSGAGAVTLKSVGCAEQMGHANPSVVAWDHGLLNAVGLSSAGYAELIAEWKNVVHFPVPLFVSIFAPSVAGFAEAAEHLVSLKPAMIELNVSCPNSDNHGQLFGVDPASAAAVVEAVKAVAGKIPVMPKLTPQASDIGSVARACEEAGADAICAINTVSGMAINIEARSPVLDFKKGGLSGPAIKPVAVRCVWDIFESVDIPVLGLGGVLTGRDAIELLQAGASAVGIGSGVYYRGWNVFEMVCGEMGQWMDQNGFDSVASLSGIAHE